MTGERSSTFIELIKLYINSWPLAIVLDVQSRTLLRATFFYTPNGTIVSAQHEIHHTTTHLRAMSPALMPKQDSFPPQTLLAPVRSNFLTLGNYPVSCSSYMPYAGCISSFQLFSQPTTAPNESVTRAARKTSY